MQTKKYQIFVSSTYSDLVDERREVIEAIIDLGHIPAGMEGFPRSISSNSSTSRRSSISATTMFLS
jgi:hypothetical protein